MKKTIVFLSLILVSGLATAQQAPAQQKLPTKGAGITFDRDGIFRVSGLTTLSIYKLYENEGSVAVGGQAALILWEGMTGIIARPADQFQPNDRKQGQGLTCERAVRDDIIGMKKGDVLCFISIKDRSKGAL